MTSRKHILQILKEAAYWEKDGGIRVYDSKRVISKAVPGKPSLQLNIWSLCSGENLFWVYSVNTVYYFWQLPLFLFIACVWSRLLAFLLCDLVSVWSVGHSRLIQTSDTKHWMNVKRRSHFHPFQRGLFISSARLLSTFTGQGEAQGQPVHQFLAPLLPFIILPVCLPFLCKQSSSAWNKIRGKRQLASDSS